MARAEVVLRAISALCVWKLICFASASWLLGGRALSQSPLRLQDYDVADLVFRETSVFGGGLGPPGDLLSARTEAEDRGFGLAIADLVQNLKDATGPGYWAEEGTEIRAEEASGLLFVRSDERMHKRVASVLAGMRKYSLEEIDVELHSLPGQSLQSGSAILRKADVDALLLQAEPHPTLRGRVRIGAEIFLASSQQVSLVHSVEVATEQGGFAPYPDPQVGAFREGASWSISVKRAVGESLSVGVWGSECNLLGCEKRAVLAAEIDRSEAARKSAPRQLAGTAEAAAPRVNCLNIQMPKFSSSEVRLTTMLQSGEGLLFGASECDGRAYCLRVHRPNPAKDPIIDVPGDPETPYLRACSVSHIVQGGREGGSISYWRSLGSETMAPSEEAPPPVVDEARLIDFIKSTIAPTRWDNNPFTIGIQAGVLYVRADAETHKLVADAIDRLGARALRRFNVEVRYGTIGPKEAAASISRDLDNLVKHLPQTCLGVAGKTGGVNLGAGRWTTFVSDYDPVIAIDGAAATPVIDRWREGANVSADVVPAGDGKVRLRFNFGLSMLAGPIESLDLSDERFGKVDLPRMNWFPCRVDPVLELDRWTLLQMSPVPGTSDHVAIVIRVREV